MKHIFDVELAKRYGVNTAVLFENIGYWIKQNEANGTNFYDGTYWTFNSRRAYRELFPYMSERQIDSAFRKLIDDGLLKTGNYNKLAYDRTLWYALTQKGKSILHFDGMDSTEMANGIPQNVEPIPNINTDINTDVNPDIKHNITLSSVECEFQTLWDKYPRKEGKQAAFKAYKKARKDGVPYETIEQGIDRYIAHITASNTMRKYIKQGSTWFNGRCWEDEYTTSTTPNEPDEMRKRWGAAADLV